MIKLKNAFEIFNNHGVEFLLKRILFKITKKPISDFSQVKKLFIGKQGLEIGGPSSIFQDGDYIPLYKIVKGVDGCNFSNSTIWEGKIESGNTYKYYQDKTGIQYISEATDLKHLPNSKYEFVISSNCLEHVANPFKALEEWIRVIKDGGLILLVLPNKKYCFDHNRPTTKFSHMLEDFQNDIKEDDLTHLGEILDLHDLKMDKPGGSLKQFKERSLNNFENRALHHHVFSVNVLKEIFDYFKIETLLTKDDEQGLIILGKKSNV